VDVRASIIVLIAWSTAAWAAGPGADGGPTPAPSDVPAQNESAAPSEPKSADAAAAVEAPGTEAARATEFRPPSGYTKKTKGGKTYYCRRETPVGTRFATDYCYTQEQLQRITKAGQSIRDDVSRRTRACSGASCMGD
jgi:hypothetical protein